MNQVLDGAKTRKLVLQTLSGAVVGAVVTYFALEMGGGAADLEDSARLAAVAAGIVYALMGAFVGLGAIVPGVFMRVGCVAEGKGGRGLLGLERLVE